MGTQSDRLGKCAKSFGAISKEVHQSSPLGAGAQCETLNWCMFVIIRAFLM